MSDKFESEIVALLEMRYSDDPCNHPNMYSRFFESNKEELPNNSIWNEIRSLASEVLDYKIKYGESNLVNEFIEEMKFYYNLWSRKNENMREL